MARYRVNKAILVGNPGRDPELRYTASGQPVADFSLATSRGHQGADGSWTDVVAWHRIVCRERLAEPASQSLHTGSKVSVEGRTQSRKYTDRQGIERTAYDIVAHDLTLLDRRREGAADADEWESAGGPHPPLARRRPQGEEPEDAPF